MILQEQMKIFPKKKRTNEVGGAKSISVVALIESTAGAHLFRAQGRTRQQGLC
jgi:hypothetical protein